MSIVLVLSPLRAVRLSSGNNSNLFVVFSITVAHHQQPELSTQSQKNKPILFLRVIRVFY